MVKPDHLSNKDELAFKRIVEQTFKSEFQPCPVCIEPIGIMPGMRESICKNCGFKDPCCE